ncbi:MBL fold metallo-hydrolase [Nannocystis punicea]|uniref:MBL fold metallo-hydrolase n=1 Tax=Nannocystis punicea TaxID=2995304 RepID=A0ABY7GYL9_9BACT|nr:MBL fold metallo-hydrolase [Nannocystis poenicansa]WAS92084.1 MBL fold metallo-hydrolase [Nannocystis poenicansa]
MRLDSVRGNTQRLDGGAMFGNVPRAMWQRWAPPDELNRISLACRCLLVRDDRGRTILFEAGIGAFFEPKLRERFGVVESEHVLLASLAELGVRPDDIDIIVLSHLHFDHAGGVLTAWSEGQAPALVFPRASYVVGEDAWQRALHPHPRDRASFIPGLTDLILATGRLERVTGDRSELLGPGYTFTVSNGHTPGLLLARIETPRGAVTFLGDLVPGVPWVHLPITMGYDRYPELLIDEKEALLGRILADDGTVFYTHDPDVAASKLIRDAHGKFTATSMVGELHWA